MKLELSLSSKAKHQCTPEQMRKAYVIDMRQDGTITCDAKPLVTQWSRFTIYCPRCLMRVSGYGTEEEGGKAGHCLPSIDVS